MRTEIKYYKPKSLTMGLLIFGISFYFFGMFTTSEFLFLIGLSDLSQVVSVVLSALGIIIGECFILNAASYMGVKDE